MNIADLLILQILAHLLSDFTFQSEKWAKLKNEMGFKSGYLKWHVIIVFVVSLVLSFQLKFIVVSLLIAIFHLIFDGLKGATFNHSKLKKYAFFIDQALHIIILVILVQLFNHFVIIGPFVKVPFNKHLLLIITGYLLITKPANIFIKEIFNSYGININSVEVIPNAGMLIGICERILALTLILYGQFEAVGFIIAAKSILRFKDTDTERTEYVLIGSLLSYGIAILTGIAIQLIK